MATIITGTNGTNGTNGASPTNGGKGGNASYTKNGVIGADTLDYDVKGGKGGKGGNGTPPPANGANGGNGGDATITVNGNIFNNPAGTDLTIKGVATGGDGGDPGTGVAPGLRGNGGNATVTFNGNIINPNKVMNNIALYAEAIGGDGLKYGNATATVNGNIVQPKSANNVFLTASAHAFGPDSVANHGNANYGIKSATLNGNIVQGNIQNVALTATAVPSNGTARINGNIVQLSGALTTSGAVTIAAAANVIEITGNKVTVNKQSLTLSITQFYPYTTTIKDNEFKGSGTNLFTFSSAAIPGPYTNTVVINLATKTFIFNGNSNVLDGFSSVTVTGNVSAMLTGDDNDNILTGTDGDDIIDGGKGNDIIYGGKGNDILLGGDGNDELHGGDGDDILDGGAGDDLLFGGAGDDILLVSTGTDVLDGVTDPLGDTASFQNATGPTGVTVDLNSAGPHNYSSAFNGVTTITTLLNIQNVTGTGFADTLIGDGQNNTLTGGAGNDILRGNGGNDTLNGGADTDTAVYAGNFAQYTVAVGITGNGTVTDTVPARDGTDTLTSIEFIQFNDGTFNTATQTFVPNGPVHVAPAGTDSTLSTPEDTAYTFTAADFGFTDSDLPPDTFTAVTITTLPGAGTLRLSGVPVTPGQVITVANIGNLTFTPALNANGNGYASFTFQVQDNGPGNNIDLSPNTITFNVSAVNDAPTATNLSAPESYTEDTPLNLTDIVVSDVDSPNVTATLTLSNVAAGSLSTGTSGAVTSTFVGGVWTASGAIADVNALLAGVTFNPALNFNGNFTVATSVSDGVAPPVTGTKAFTGVAVNDAPTATNLSAPESYTEDMSLNLTDIVVSDVDSPNVTATLTLSNVAAGSLSTGTSGAVTSTFVGGVWTASGAIADVNALLAGVTFNPALNFNGNFTIGTSVSDGVAPPVTGTKAFTGTAVNDAPTATNLSAPESYTEDTPLNLTDIVVSDVDSPNVTATLTLSNVAAGSLSTGTSGAVTSTFVGGVWTASGAIADVNALLAGVTFNPAANFNGNFTIATSVSDGVAPPVTGTKAFTGTAVNDAPAGADNTISTAMNGAYVFTAADFGFTDPIDSPANSLLAVKITTLPTDGQLTNNGNPVLAGQFISVADINGGNLVFTPDLNESGAGYASFTFQVQDNGGTANGGVDLDQSPNTITFDVNGGENYFGTPGDDNHTGTPFDDVMHVSAGNDILNGGGHVLGDTLSFDTAQQGVNAVLNGVTTGYTVGGLAGTTTASNFEHLTGSAYDDTLTGDNNFNIISGGAGDDLLIATPGGDTLDGGANNAGGDTASFVLAGSGVTVNLGGATQNVGGGIGNVTLVNIENLTGSNFADTLTGNGGNNVLNGGAGNDVLIGGLGNDTLNGGADIDTALFSTQPGVGNLTANGGNWTVTGPDGTDTLNGVEIVDDGVGGRILLVGSGGFATINAALAAAANGDTILIAPGTYNEYLLITKEVTLVGAGNPGDVVLQGDFRTTQAGGPITGLISDWLKTRTQGQGGYDGEVGVVIHANNVGLTNLTLQDYKYAIGTQTRAEKIAGNVTNTVSDLTLTDVDINGAVTGFQKEDGTTLNRLTINGGSFTDMLFGVYLANGVPSAGDSTDFVIQGSTFSTILQKGLYIETAQGNTLVDGLTMTDVGNYGGVPTNGADGLNGNAIQFNLKYHVYTGTINVTDNVLSNVGKSGGTQYAAIVVEGRDDPASYNTNPANVSGLAVNISGGSIDDTKVGIRAGEVKGNTAQHVTGPAITIDGVVISNATEGMIDNRTRSLMTVNGSAGDDIYMSNQAAASIGRIAFYGHGGADYLVGGLGDDLLQGGSGDDTLDGSGGIDAADYGDATEDGLVVDLAAGTSSGGYGLLSNNDTLFNIENVYGSAFNDTLIGDGNDNVLRGRAGDDVLDGNGGTDTADYSDATEDGLIVDLGAGTSSGGYGPASNNDTLFNIANVTGSDFADTLIGDGNSNTLRGGKGDDYLDGGSGGSDTADYSDATGNGLVVDLMNSASSGGGLGNDTLINIQNVQGSSFNDKLIGDGGDNVLSGGAGNDILYGHGGTNTLIGGSGTDVAYYYGREADYTITPQVGYRNVAGGPEDVGDGGAGDFVFNDVERLKFLATSHVSDVDGGILGTSDLVFQNAATGALNIVLEPEPGTPLTAIAVGGSNWRAVGTGQFNPDADRRADVLLQDTGNGNLKVVTDLTGAQTQTGLTIQPGSADWKAIATGDFNGDAASDVLLQNQVTGAARIMFLNTNSTDAVGTVANVASLTTPGANWKAIAAGDFNGDGKSDVVWQNSSTKAVQVRLMDGATVINTPASQSATGLTAIATGDFNGDGNSDILFKNGAGQAVLWFMNGATRTGTKTVTHPMTPGVTWAVSGAADVDGNGYSDIIWNDALTGDTSATLLGGPSSAVGTTVLNSNFGLTSPGAGYNLMASTGGG